MSSDLAFYPITNIVDEREIITAFIYELGIPAIKNPNARRQDKIRTVYEQKIVLVFCWRILSADRGHGDGVPEQRNLRLLLHQNLRHSRPSRARSSSAASGPHDPDG